MREFIVTYENGGTMQTAKFNSYFKSVNFANERFKESGYPVKISTCDGMNVLNVETITEAKTATERQKESVTAFVKVRDKIDRVKHPEAYNRAFKKPYRFYREHTTDEAIKILISECK